MEETKEGGGGGRRGGGGGGGGGQVPLNHKPTPQGEVRFNVPSEPQQTPNRPKRGRPPPMKLNLSKTSQDPDAINNDEAEQGIVLTAVFTPDTPYVDDPVWGRFYIPHGRFGVRPLLRFLLCPCYHGRSRSCRDTICCCTSSTSLPPVDEEGERKECWATVVRYLASVATWILIAQVVMLGVGMSVVVVPISINWLIGPSGKTLTALGAKDAPLMVHGGEGWRLFSSLFLYAGLVQLVAMLPLHARIGVFLEYHWGKFPWLTVYILSGVFGMAVSALLTPSMITVGGGAGLAGVLGAWLSDLLLRLWARRSPKEPPQQVHVELLMWAVDMAFLLFCSFSIYNDPLATIAAAVFGFLLGFPFFIHIPTWRAVAVRTIAAVAAVVLFSIILANLFFGTSVPMKSDPFNIKQPSE